MADADDEEGGLSMAELEVAVNGGGQDEEKEDAEEEAEETTVANEAMAVASETDLTSLIMESKSIPKLERKPQGISKVWDCYYCVEVPDSDVLDVLQKLDDSAYNKINGGMVSGKQYVACRACLEDSSKPLWRCLHMPTYKKDGSGRFDGTGNPGKHLRNQKASPEEPTAPPLSKPR